MNARTAAARDRRKAIARIARSMHRANPNTRPEDVLTAVGAAGWRVSRGDVIGVLRQAGLHRR